jgi:acyl-CoA synthetase (AMP-forming)/AMP-acid ligase II
MANLAQHLFQRARAYPDAIALIDQTLARHGPARPASMARHGHAQTHLSFAAFAQRVARLAGGLRAQGGLKAGDRVVLMMENRPEFLDLLFACWTAGLCAVPVNAKLHPKEVAHIVGDCGARVAVVSESLAPEVAPALAGLAARLMVTSSEPFAALYDAAPIACAEVAPTDLAWIFYTSGTTGRPKGAMLSHRNLLFMALTYSADIEQVAPGDVKLHAAPLSHASGLYSLPHLLGGGTQVILDGFEPDQVLEAFDTYRHVTVFAAPTMVTRLLGAVQPGRDYPGLRTLYYGGGPMYVSDLQRAIECFGPRLYQLFGQGESPMTISGLPKAEHAGDGGEAHRHRLASCGLPRTGVEVRVVDDEGRDVPVGELGEVITRSDAVMQGYWNNPQATAQALREGWLWTGDIGFLDERGYLSLRDRSKDMIISGGTNIYPREIEEVLLLHPGVLECSVVGRPHPEWGEEVVAFIVPRPGPRPTAADLEALCLDHIARFKRPKDYRFVDNLPKNNYGKVLKTALRQMLQQENPHA